MYLRTITACLNGKHPVHKGFFKDSVSILEQYGIEVRTKRICLPFLDHTTARSVIEVTQKICLDNDVRWICAPFDLLNCNRHDEIVGYALKILNYYDNVFVNFVLGNSDGVTLSGALAAAQTVKLVSNISNTGYDNFRFGTSFNCKANGPFFPFTYQDGENGFSFACELVPILFNVINEYKDLDRTSLKDKIISVMASELLELNDVAELIETLTGFKFYGIDASIAPYPDSDDNSVAGLIELLGVDTFGGFGTLHFTSYLTDIIRQAVKDIKTVGFNGVMYSVLEDSVLSKNDRSNNYSIDSLMAYATVCGCGIDMVPIPGEVFEGEIASLMVDVGTMAAKLNKPLGVRLLPVPNGKVNQFTLYNYDFLCNTRIQNIKNLSYL
jgi:uncharacterized protein (UPF0210 family)